MSTFNSSQDACSFESPFIMKARSNSIQLTLGNGLASIFLPNSFSEEKINDLMNLASKFEFDEEDDDEDNIEQKENNKKLITLNDASQCSSLMENDIVFN